MNKRRRKHRSAWAVFFMPIKLILFAFFSLMVFGGVICGIVYLKYKGEIMECREKAESIMKNTSREDFTQPTDTKIYDANGGLIGTINTGHYKYVPIEDISKNLQNAYVAQEDRRFYTHHGLDYRGLLRAGIVAVKNKGKATQGASTITQQVVKNTYLTQERKIKRKLTEIFTVPYMEKVYSKADIMEFYCNTNFYQNRCYGVAKASKYYFDKEPKDLTIWEAATLAGISNSPARYNPVSHPEACKGKRNQVIDSMAICGFITEKEKEDAKAQPLTVEKVTEPGTKDNYQTSYAIYCAAVELMKNDGFSFQYVFRNKSDYESYKERYQELYQEKSDLIRKGGFEIHTSLQPDIQTSLQNTIDKRLERFTKLQNSGKFALQGAAVCVDNRSGYVVAIVGGRGTDDQFNRGFLSKRQPGSTIKPLIDYAPAFETGYYYPSRIVDDHKFDKGPRNSGNKYRGRVSVREALNRSLNTVAWQILADIGVDYGIGYLGKMHFVGLSYLDNGNESMSIGGFTEGARVVDMAKGYSVLANGGVYSNKTCITSITSQYDGELYQSAQGYERIFTEDTAYMITDVLKGTMNKPYGTGRGLGLKIPAAGKTGTTNSSKDTWFCGYTKYYTTAVWVGYDTPKSMPGVYGSTYAGRIWHDFMTGINEGLEAKDWDMPPTVSLMNVDWIGDKTTRKTGKKDLFSSVAEAAAKADTKKWKQEEKRRQKDAAAQRKYQQAMAAEQAVGQKVAALQAIIAELNAATHSSGAYDSKIGTAQALLQQLNGTQYYDGLKGQLDAAVSYVLSLPKEETTPQPTEVGPGVNIQKGPTVPATEPAVQPVTEPQMVGPGM
jgi:penicillin-binding protein 1A